MFCLCLDSIHCDTAQVILEETKQEKVVLVEHVHDWLEHLRMHPHLWKAWKSRAPKTSTDPRDRAPVLGFLICPKETKSRRLEWYRAMRPQFEALVAQERCQRLFAEAQNRRPWSHRFPTWRDERFHVAKPRQPNHADARSDWLLTLAPKTFLSLSGAAGGAAAQGLSEPSKEGQTGRAGRRAAARRDKQQGPSPAQVASAKAAARVAEASLELEHFSRHAGNNAALEELLRISSGGLARHVLVHGKEGSGKQSAVALLVRKTLAAQVARAEGGVAMDGVETEAEQEALSKWAGGLVLELGHETLKSDNALRAAITAFSKKNLHGELYRRLAAAGGDGKKPSVTRFLVLRNFEKVPASLQMVLVHRLEEVESLGLRFVFIAADASAVVSPLRANLLSLHLKGLPIDAWLERLLTVCVAQRVGFNREGMQLIVWLAKGDLGAAVNILQQTFVKEAFVSRQNVVKVAAQLIAERSDAEPPVNAFLDKPAPPPRQSLDAEKIRPRPEVLNETMVLGKSLRCRICTLPPPCKHMSGPELIQLARQRAAGLNRDPEMPACPTFVRTGACEAINTLGYCRLNHDPTLYSYAVTTRRCPICTVPEPCGNCPWFLLRRDIAKAVAAAAEELATLKHKGERSSVTLAKFRSLFDREVAAAEALLDENARWLNCTDRSSVHNLTDTDLVRGKYSTNEQECKARLRQLQKKWDFSLSRLALWLSGQSARHLNAQSGNVAEERGEASGKQRYRAEANLPSRRYMPSATQVVADYNGTADWDSPSALPRESPVIRVNKAVIKMGLSAKAEDPAPRREESSEEVEKKRKSKLAQEKRERDNEARKGMSIFAK